MWTKDQRNAYMREYRKSHPSVYHSKRTRNSYLKHEFGITLNDYNVLFAAQSGMCAICKTHQSSLKKSLAVDHDHATNKIRGLLCTGCNTAIGSLKDNIQYIENAAEYLKRSR